MPSPLTHNRPRALLSHVARQRIDIERYECRCCGRGGRRGPPLGPLPVVREDAVGGGGGDRRRRRRPLTLCAGPLGGGGLSFSDGDVDPSPAHAIRRGPAPPKRGMWPLVGLQQRKACRRLARLSRIPIASHCGGAARTRRPQTRSSRASTDAFTCTPRPGRRGGCAPRRGAVRRGPGADRRLPRALAGQHRLQRDQQQLRRHGAAEPEPDRAGAVRNHGRGRVCRLQLEHAAKAREWRFWHGCCHAAATPCCAWLCAGHTYRLAPPTPSPPFRSGP